jgi:SAM-dependent methyltransferase
MDYLQINKQLWNERAALHPDSAFYEMEAFRSGKNSLKEIELSLLGSVAGKTLLHLQCHFGQDTLSLARMGATVSGVDFSEEAIARARKLSDELQIPAKFYCSDIYAFPQQTDEQFDIVFSSYGTIGWLPDIDKWAAVVAHHLKPGGRFIFAEFHPVIWMFDNDFKEVAYKYNKSEPIVETLSGTYADREAAIQHQSVSWNHGLAEVIGSLLRQGLQLKQFQEFDYSPYDCFAHTEERSPGKFQIKAFGDRIPMVYALEAIKP